MSTTRLPYLKRQATKFVTRRSAVAVLLCAAVLSAGTASAQQESQPRAEGNDVPQIVEIQHLPEAVTLAKLSNGLTVIVQENHAAPVATVRCFVKNTGAINEGKYLGAGLSHVLEHVVSGGTTTKRTEKEIEAIVDGMGGATNAYTTTAHTAYYIDCPADKVDTAIELVADSMQHITFEPNEFERELRVVRRELADGEVNRQRVLWKMVNATLYHVHPAQHPTIGYLDVLNRTSNQAIIDFYRSRYIPNNQVFVVVGKVSTDHVLEQVAESYRGTRRGFETYIPLPDEPPQLSPRESYREMEGQTIDFVIAWPTVKLSHSDLYPLDVAAYVLGEGTSSRLSRRLKLERPLALSVEAVSYTPHFVHGWFGVMGSCLPENYPEVRKIILQEVERLRTEPVSPDELAKAKKQKAAELVFGRQTVQDAAESLGRSYLSTGDPLFDVQYVKEIEQVTAEQIRTAAQRYFVPQRLNTVVIAPPGQLPQQAAEAAGSIESPVRKIVLDNGLRVLVKRQSHLPLVHLQVVTLGSALLENDETAGRSAMMAAMFNKGTDRHTAVEIAEYFDSIGAKVSFSAGRSTILGGLTVLREDFPQAAERFAECLTRPAFPEEEFSKVKQLMLAAVARRADNPMASAMETFQQALPAESPYHVINGGTKESLTPVTVDDIRRWYERCMVPQNTVVAVYGDVDPDEAVTLVKRLFAPLAAHKEAPAINFDRPNLIPQDRVVYKATSQPTGIVLLGYRGVSVRDKADYAALTVLDAMSSGYQYPGGWLHNELRGAGLVYAVHAFLISGPAPGFFAVNAQTAPETVDEVIARIRKNIDKAKSGDFSDEELARAKEMIINLHAQENTTAADQALKAALDELYGLGYDHDVLFPKQIASVTREDVLRVAREYLTQSVLAVVAPNPPAAYKGPNHR
ncbi:pitrilysin family protein [Thermostilla marina]